MAPSRPPPMPQVDVLPQVLNEVVVTTGKALRAAKRDGKGNLSEAIAIYDTRIPAAVEKYHLALDELECDILRAKSVLMRDLNELRASRKPPVPEQQQQQVAPPAPMTIGLESPKMALKEAPTSLTDSQVPAKQVSKPVAPFPNMNMGFDSTSPKAAHAATTTPKPTPKPKDVTSVARPTAAAAAAAAVGRAASAPPKKEVKIPAPQVPKSGGAVTAPQTPLNAPVQTKTTPIPASITTTPAVPPNNAPGPAGPENIFTDMTFSLAPVAGDGPALNPAEAPQLPATMSLQVPPAPVDNANLGGSNLSGFTIEPFTGDDAGNAEAKIDNLFDLGPGGMANMELDYDLGGDSNENSNFNDMFFGAGDGGTSTGEFDNAYFNLNV